MGSKPSKANVCSLSLVFAASALLCSCAHQKPNHDFRPQQPLVEALKVVSVDGKLEGRLDAKNWQALKSSSEHRGLRALRASGNGALLAFGGTRGGKIWLRGGSEVQMGRSDGQVVAYLVAGEMRVSNYDGKRLSIYRPGQKQLETSGRDVIVRKQAKKGAAEVINTASVGKSADWTFALLDGETATAGLGSLRAHDRNGVLAHLRLRRVWVKAKRAGDATETVVEHIFYNESSERLEGTFRFPLPQGASLTGLAMEINGKLMEGELVERQKARRIYEKIVDAMEDPALLEWTQGNTFKLRVFPIEPKSEKRILLRYIAPLSRSASGSQFRYETAAAAMQKRIDRFRLDFDGETIVDQKNFIAGQAIAVPLVKQPQMALRETKKDATYTLFRVTTPWLAARTPSKKRTTRDLVIIVDTSRSALESRTLSSQSLSAILEGLGRDDRFVVLASDLQTRAHRASFAEASPETRKEALAFISNIEPDGASDVGAALKVAGRFARQARDGRQLQVIYLGDGTATWGETDGSKLKALAQKELGEAPFFALVLGKGANGKFLADIASQQGGRVSKPHRHLDARRFSLMLAEAPSLERLRKIQLRAGEKDVVYPRHPGTLFSGDELRVLVRTPAGEKPPEKIVIDGQVDGRRLTRSIAAMSVAPTAHVARRWARHHIAYLQDNGGDKAEIVKQSLEHGVLSRHTAYLVLESEEAYKRHKIARRKKAEAEKRRISGADLESIGGRQARLSPDHLQPGDPEVRIPAPADAKSVVVVFPFGETKIARYESDLKAWTVRFLVDKDTPDGTYQVTVRITHHDDRVEVLKLSYVVDTKAPTVKLSIKRIRGRGQRALYKIIARQIVTKVELKREARRWKIGGKTIDGDTLDSRVGKMAALVQDAKKVDILAPDGRLITLRPLPGGAFRTYWRAKKAIQGPLNFKVVAVDKAYNRNVFVVSLDPATGRQTTLSAEDAR